ncbi:LysM peptidoglycan-binding domain-containing protein, partial [Thermomonospora catenispora]|uniref:LysM peptidoglycan-binding domain-containing protein n=1 Tax=Thermomonospora catenispora TaxID=2493090 RepID=UPI0019D50EA8
AARPAAGRPGASRPAPRRRPATPVADAGPVRLTRRGKVVVGIGVAGLMAGSFWLGTMSGEREETTPRQDAWVVVQSGDTLWTIATRARPDADPHTTVQRIIEANRLGGAAVRPGQALRIPGG